jgi:hypothetical protein
VDRTGDLRDAFERAKTLAGLKSAKLVKYHSEGETPKTAYAAAPAPGVGAGVEVNVLNVEGLESLLGFAGGRAYYLWMP